MAASALGSQSQQIVAQHLEKLPSPPTVPMAEAAKSVIDPNVKPPPGSVFSNPVNNNLQGVISNPFNEAKNAFTPPPTGLDSSGAEFARPLTDLAFQAGHTFYNGVRQVCDYTIYLKNDEIFRQADCWVLMQANTSLMKCR